MKLKQSDAVRRFGAYLAIGPMVMALLMVTSLPGVSQGAAPLETTRMYLIDSSGDELLQRTAVPNRLLKQGEVRLVRRGKGLVVQTLLQTHHLDRVIKKITGSEQQNWAPGHAGFADMQRFVDALEEQGREAKTQAENQGEKARLLIEFIALDQEVAVVFCRPVVVTSKSGWDVASREQLESLQLSPAYVRQNMELILQDAFVLKPPEVLAMLREVAWVPSVRLASGSNTL